MSGFKISVGADSSKAEKTLSNFEKKTHKIAKSIAKGFKERIGHKLFDGLSSAAAGVPGILNKSIKAASDLNEEISKSQAIFGKSASKIKTWANGAADAMGMSTLKAMEASGGLGNLMTAMGLSETKAAGMSMQMVQLAADMASFNNTSTDDAIMALSAALRGENEPIRRYIGILDDATIKAQAFAMGIGDGKKALDPTSRALATYQAILAKTKNQQGDFQRTSDGLANSKKKLTAQFEDAASEIGEALLPAMTDLVQLMTDTDWKSVGQDIGQIASVFVDLTRSVGDAYNGLKEFIELAITAKGPLKGTKYEGFADALGNIPGFGPIADALTHDGLLPDIKKNKLSDEAYEAIRRANEGGSKNQGDSLPADPEWDKMMEEFEKDKEAWLNGGEQEEGAKKNKKANEEERKSVWGLIQDYKDLAEEKAKEARAQIERTRRDTMADLSMREAETLAQFGRGSGFKKANRIDELKRQGLTQADAEGIAGREGDIDNLNRTQDMLTNLSGRSNVQAVSSMQKIGGGGGASTSPLSIQKRQATLQAEIVEILKKMESNQPGVEISDF